VLSVPTLQYYSNGQIVRWIGTPTDDSPSPTVDVTAAGGPLLDVTGGDAGPPAKLPADLLGHSAATTVAAAPASTSDHAKAFAIIAVILAALALIVGVFALVARRRSSL
jgi:hypothetical protein